jgi:hypothetical protein
MRESSSSRLASLSDMGLFELARVLVRFDHVARRIVNADQALRGRLPAESLMLEDAVDPVGDLA